MLCGPEGTSRNGLRLPPRRCEPLVGVGEDRVAKVRPQSKAPRPVGDGKPASGAEREPARGREPVARRLQQHGDEHRERHRRRGQLAPRPQSPPRFRRRPARARDPAFAILRPHQPPERECDECRERPLVHRIGERSDAHRRRRAEAHGARDRDRLLDRREPREQDSRELVDEESGQCRGRGEHEGNDARRPPRADHREERNVEQGVVIGLDLRGGDVPPEGAPVPPRPRVVVVIVLQVPVGVLSQQNGERSLRLPRARQEGCPLGARRVVV